MHEGSFFLISDIFYLHNMKFSKKYVILIALAAIIIALLVVLGSTNPPRKDHLQFITSRIGNAEITMTEKEEAMYNSFLQGYGVDLMEKMIKPAFRYDDYEFFSLGKLNDKSVTLGIFGKVYSISDEDIVATLKGDNLDEENAAAEKRDAAEDAKAKDNSASNQ